MSGKENRPKRKRSVIGTLILMIAAGVFIFAAYKLATLGHEYMKGRQEYAGLRDYIQLPEVKTPDGYEVEDVGEVDFDELKEINSDIVAWIRFPEPEIINYPVVRGNDNDYYLHRSFEKEYLFSGCIFEDFQNNRNFSDSNVILYGHNMNDKSMFAKLRSYVDEDGEEFCRENPYFYIYLPDDSILKYQVFSAYVLNLSRSEEPYTIFRSNHDPDQFAQWLALVRGYSMYTTDAQVTQDAKVITLSSCTNTSDQERIVIHGVLAETLRAADLTKIKADDVLPE